VNRARRLLKRSDPARHLGPVFDERAEAELEALFSSRSVDTFQRTRAVDVGPRRRLQTVLVTGLVAAAVAGVSVAVIANGPVQGGAGDDTVAATAPAAVPTATPMSTSDLPYSGPLIAMDGARSLTRAQLHAWTVENAGVSANAKIGEEQDWLTIQCMAGQGYLYDPTFEGNQGLERGKTWGLTPKQLQGYRAALWGANLTTVLRPYDWRKAGCDGRSVHLTGQDDAH
jgi:hypothetical protein